MFDAATQHAAAQEKSVDVPGVLTTLGDRRGQRDRSRQNDRGHEHSESRAGHRTQAPAGLPPRARTVVKLNWFVRSVSCAARRRSSAPSGAKSTTTCRVWMKSANVSVSAREFLRRNSSRYSSVRRSSSLVVFPALEFPHMLHEAQRALRLLRPLNREHLRAAGPNLGAFDRVVVDEHEAVEPEVEPRGEGLRRFCDLGCQLIMAATT